MIRSLLKRKLFMAYLKLREGRLYSFQWQKTTKVSHDWDTWRSSGQRVHREVSRSQEESLEFNTLTKRKIINQINRMFKGCILIGLTMMHWNYPGVFPNKSPRQLYIQFQKLSELWYGSPLFFSPNQFLRAPWHGRRQHTFGCPFKNANDRPAGRSSADIKTSERLIHIDFDSWSLGFKCLVLDMAL